MTDDLAHRVSQHRSGVIAGFTRRYDVKMPVRFEEHGTRESAFLRARQLKRWNRAWKLKLIATSNPQWHDLADEIATLR
jgi:putative endonuclease